MKRLLSYQLALLVIVMKLSLSDGTKVTIGEPEDLNFTSFQTESPFPFLSFDDNGEMIVEAYAAPDDIPEDEVGSRCHHTYSLLEGQSLQFRSQNYPSDSPTPMTSVTCFNSPQGTKISLSCEDINMACGQARIGIATNGDPQSSYSLCGRRFRTYRETSEANSLAVIFKTDGIKNIARKKNTRQPRRFKCKIATIKVGNETDSLTTTQVLPSARRSASCNCGQSNSRTRIVGGTAAGANEFPWRCYVQVGGAFCGCSLISNTWVMTAAHCTQRSGNGNVILGAHQIGRGHQVTTVSSSRIINHPQYNSRTVQNDISLIQLSRKISSSREISPVCLPFNMRRDTFVGSRAVTSGWGRTGSSGSIARTLQKVEVPVLNNRQCRGARVTSDMICAFEPGKGTCNGDSGGSLDLLRNSRYYAIGITSWGDASCRRLSVFSRVTHFLDWIETNTRENFCKV